MKTISKEEYRSKHRMDGVIGMRERLERLLKAADLQRMWNFIHMIWQGE